MEDMNTHGYCEHGSTGPCVYCQDEKIDNLQAENAKLRALAEAARELRNADEVWIAMKWACLHGVSTPNKVVYKWAVIEAKDNLFAALVALEVKDVD